MNNFTHLPAVAAYIRRHHSEFAGLPVSEALRVLASAKAAMDSNTAIVGITYTAAQMISDAVQLDTYITIERDARGIWSVTESTQAP